jgi:hypothetical protein
MDLLCCAKQPFYVIFKENTCIFPKGIRPEQTEINGRVFRSYTESDIDKLNLIACLRKTERE